MRKLVTLASAAALCALGASMSTAQDNAQTAAGATSRTYDLTGFDGVSVVGPHHIVVSVGPAFSVRAEGPQQTLSDTEVEVEDGRLKIHPVDDDDYWDRRCGDDRRDHGRWRCWNDYEAATFYVTLPQIESAALIGGGDMRIDRVEGNAFAASVAGSGDLDVAALRVDDARFSIAGSGDLVARGSARNSHVSIAGSGNLQAREVTSTEAHVSIAGSGNAALTVQEDAHVSIVGSGDVEIAGPARCTVSRFGGGKVRCNGENVSG